jgi:hypothetical protein
LFSLFCHGSPSIKSGVKEKTLKLLIHLYEADYNLILSVKWRQLLRFACDNQFVNESQFGSRPGREAIDAVFFREMEYDISRMTRKPVIHFDNDVTSCYDRINACIGNIISRKYGMHRNVCLVEGRTSAEARYHLKTKLGISDEFVQHSRLHLWFGMGQGAGDSTYNWLFISSTLLDKYETLFYQMDHYTNHLMGNGAYSYTS